MGGGPNLRGGPRGYLGVSSRGPRPMSMCDGGDRSEVFDISGGGLLKADPAEKPNFSSALFNFILKVYADPFKKNTTTQQLT